MHTSSFTRYLKEPMSIFFTTNNLTEDIVTSINSNNKAIRGFQMCPEDCRPVMQPVSTAMETQIIMITLITMMTTSYIATTAGQWSP